MKRRFTGLALALLFFMAGCGGETVKESDPIPANTYAAEQFMAVDGFLTYTGDDPSYVGVDVSAHQGEIDWTRVAAAGVEFAMIRAGYRGYTEGGIYQDEFFVRNVSGALEAGLKVGVYFFSQAVTEREAEEEARQVLEWIAPYDVQWPVVFDWERQSSETSRTRDTDGETVTACAAAFCTVIADGGYVPMVYFSPSKGYSVLELAALTDWPFWLAHYTDDWAASSFRYHFDLWQYTSSGAVDGIMGKVDLDLCMRDFSAEPKEE